MNSSLWRHVPLFIKLRLRFLLWGKLFPLLTKPNPAANNVACTNLAVVYLIPNLGDCIMLFPLLDELRRENPDMKISCFTYAGGRILGRHHGIDCHYNLPQEEANRFQRLGVLGLVIAIWLWWSKDLKALRFDKCVLLRGGIDPFGSAHLAWLLGGHERIGFSAEVEPEIKQFDLGQDRMLTHRITGIDGAHEIERGYKVLSEAGLIRNPVNINEKVSSVARLADEHNGVRFFGRFPELSNAYAVVAPGSSVEYRRWPGEQFASVAERDFSRRGLVTVLVGGTSELDLCKRVARSIKGPVLNLAGKTDLLELVTLCKNARAFLGNDSGPAHIAGACGVPTLIISAFAQSGRRTHHNSPHRSRPAGPYVEVVQPEHALSPCCERCESNQPHCILQVSVDQVSAAIERLFTKASAEFSFCVRDRPCCAPLQ
jgi:ADP-heptose:LPS heptosyltransferase